MRATDPGSAGNEPAGMTPYADLAELPADHPGRRIAEIAAAGGHHLALSGPGGLLIAQNLHALLPDLDPHSATQVADLHQCVGLPTGDAKALTRPPWQAPHHTMSTATLIGGRRRPGVVSLARAGILYLDQAADQPTTSVNALRQVLDDDRVILGPGHLVYPARLQLVLASTGCPAAETDCTCPPAQRRRSTPGWPSCSTGSTCA